MLSNQSRHRTNRTKRGPALLTAGLAAMSLLASAGATAKVLVSNDFSGLTITQIANNRWAQRFTTGNERTRLTAVQISGIIRVARRGPALGVLP